MSRTDESGRALREAVERLVDSWPTGDNGQDYRRGVAQCAEAIRALLAEHHPTPAEEPAEVAVEEREALAGVAFEHFDEAETHMGRCYLEADVLRLIAALTAKAKAEGLSHAAHVFRDMASETVDRRKAIAILDNLRDETSA